MLFGLNLMLFAVPCQVLKHHALLVIVSAMLLSTHAPRKATQSFQPEKFDMLRSEGTCMVFACDILEEFMDVRCHALFNMEYETAPFSGLVPDFAMILTKISEATKDGGHYFELSLDEFYVIWLGSRAGWDVDFPLDRTVLRTQLSKTHLLTVPSRVRLRRWITFGHAF
jgi:hypothetical protein